MEEFLRFISQNTFSQIVSLTGGIASILSLLLTTITFVLADYSKRNKLQKAEESKFMQAMQSDSISQIGFYLDDTLGQFTIHEYTSSTQVAKRVDQYIERIQDFVGTEEKIKVAPTTEPPEEIGLEYKDLPEPFLPIFNELRIGEPWNALARLRRLIEMRLRNRAISLGFKDRILKSAGQILRILVDRKYVKPNIFEMLQYSITICNRAIHGIDISQDEAEQAIYSAVEALQHIESNNYNRGLT